LGGFVLSQEILEYVEKHTRSPAIREQLLAVLRRIASGECVTWADVRNSSLKQHFQALRRSGLLVAVIRSGRRACLEFASSRSR
jgi:hypothetical protein